MAKNDQQKPLNDVVRDIIAKMSVATEEGSEAHGDEFHSVHRAQLKRLQALFSPTVGIGDLEDHEAKRFFADVVGIVIATDEERHMIWGENDRRKKPDAELHNLHKTWVSSNTGYMFQVGYLAHLPICVQCTTDIIDGHKILWVYPCSRVVDHDMVRDWCKQVAKKHTKLPADTIFPNGTNWHNALPRKAA